MMRHPASGVRVSLVEKVPLPNINPCSNADKVSINKFQIGKSIRTSMINPGVWPPELSTLTCDYLAIPLPQMTSPSGFTTT